jgi:hypothetical protein
MKSYFIWICVLSLFCTHFSFAQKFPLKVFQKSYFFSDRFQRCINSKGDTGFNLGTWGPCTDFTGMSFKKKSKRLHLGYKNDLTGSNFEGRNLSNTSFNSTILRRAQLRGTQLKNTIFNQTNLRQADLRGADLSGAQFVGYGPKRYQLEGALFDDNTILTTLLDSEEPKTESKEPVTTTPVYRTTSREFGLTHGMIRWVTFTEGKSKITQIEGGIISSVSWNRAEASGIITYTDGQTNGGRYKFSVKDFKLFLNAKALKKQGKIRVEIEKDTVVSVEKL